METLRKRKYYEDLGVYGRVIVSVEGIWSVELVG